MAALPLLILQHARKKIFVSNNTDKKNIVSDKCHKLSFYFDLHLLDNDLHFLDSFGIGIRASRGAIP